MPRPNSYRCKPYIIQASDGSVFIYFIYMSLSIFSSDHQSFDVWALKTLQLICDKINEAV